MTACQCGEPFTATTDGRQRHRVIFDHTPVAQGPVIVPEMGMSGKCAHRRHNECGGGCLHGGQPAECGCWCHEDGGS